MRNRIWENLTADEATVRRLAEAVGVTGWIARLLTLRGIDEPDAARRFLAPSLDHLHDPLALADMHVARERVCAAIARGERIAIHGDYDVDGITSTVILRRAIEMLGGDVVHFIPERLRDGYGLQAAAVERLHGEGVRVIVSVDCGIRSVDAARRARDLGIDLIITDHHEPDGTLPPALAVINPKRRDCAYPDKHLAGVGVALKLVQALCAQHDRLAWLPGFVKIAAIGTLADVVPLVGENRVIAKIGLERLSAGPNSIGVQALLETAGVAGRPLDSYHVAFMIAPRVNAAGRMSSPDIATRLLLTSDVGLSDEARRLAALLEEENDRRRQEEAEIVAQARERVEHDPGVGAHNVLVVAGDQWHRGVIGIVASKLVELYHKPSIVVSLDGDVAHGSCRSISAFDMLGALEGCAELFDRFGGHRQAAGLTMPADRVGEFRARINAHADEVLDPRDLQPRLRIDARLRLSEITPDLIQGLEQLAPFGTGNPRPVFCSAGLEIVHGPRRLKDRHLTMSVRQDRRVMRAIAWRGAERLDFVSAHRQALDLAYSVEKSHYQGETYLELTVADLRAAAGGDSGPA